MRVQVQMGRVLVLTFLCILTACFVCDGDELNTTCSTSDLDALTDFKNGLQDSGNRLQTWHGSNCCQWQGIGCNNTTGAVISIDLKNPSVSSAFSLSGEISPSLLKLKSLQYLDLSLNAFNQIPVPEFLGSFQNLQYLNLSKAGFSGVVPPALGNLSTLNSLDVSSELFSGLSVSSLDWVTRLVSLKHLAMDRTDLSLVSSNFFESLNMLPSLTSLHLSSCGLSGSISSLSHVNFSSLEVLDLSLNDFNSLFPDWLVNVSSLVHVDLSICGLYGRIPLGLSELPNLEYLNLAMNDNLSASCSQLFRGSWKKIEVIDLATNKLHGRLPASIGSMSSLVVFDLFVNSVEGGIPPSIGKLCNLKMFRLSGNNLTGNLPEFLEANNCEPNSVLPSLVQLDLSSNRLVGDLPNWLDQLKNLVELSLSNNLFQGSIPASIGNLRNLSRLGLTNNQLTGPLPDSFGKLSELSYLDVSLNHLTGSISEVHFSTLSKLKFLFLSSNSIVFNVSSIWIPPFQAQNLDVGSCHLGPSFPAWLRTQKKLLSLSIGNASISDTIPDWFWGITSNLSLLNISFNHLQGQVPNPFTIAPFADVDFSSNLLAGPIPLPAVEIELLDLSQNRFSGPIPQNLSLTMPNLIFLSLSDNTLTGNIPISIGDMQSLQVIDLSRNNLVGAIPASVGKCSFLKALDLSSNNLLGNIPLSLGQLEQLQSLHLSHNQLTGNLPSTFRNLSSLETLDIGNNALSDSIPPWIGDGFSNLRILSLRSNAISGEIPTTISNLSSLQVLDLALNNLTGSIPWSFGNFKAMLSKQNKTQYLLYGKYRGVYFEENFVANIKGGPQKYTKTLSLVISIDISGNNLDGEIPDGITKLFGLVALNLSDNEINGRIPENISNLQELLSLDLSGQMSTFTASSFTGNPGLCGDPLEVKCQGSNNSDKGETIVDDEDDSLIDRWFYLSVGLGFAAGILVPMFVFSIRRPWADAYFTLVDRVVKCSMKGRTAKCRN
ncbi:Receptor-like protein EIX2 [Euphorbia peplus]|nr:Receptor-like protein EIX2 [Euphorbia peplus]